MNKKYFHTRLNLNNKTIFKISSDIERWDNITSQSGFLKMIPELKKQKRGFPLRDKIKWKIMSVVQFNCRGNSLEYNSLEKYQVTK